MSNIFMQAMVRNPSGPIIVWCDLMKAGRLTGNDVNDYVELIGGVLNKGGPRATAIVVAPFLTSEKVTSGHRGELRLVC